MPNRIIKESICYSDDIDQLTPFEETVFYRLLVNVDDYGRIDARAQFLKSKLFATKKGITDKNVEDAVSKLASIGLVRLYRVDEKPFLLFPKWAKHQRIRNSKEKYPAPANDEDLQLFAANCGELPPESNPNPESESNPDISSSAEPPSEKFTDDSDEMKLCLLLAERMRRNNPDCRLPDDFQGWCKHIDLMIRVDGRTPKQIQDVILFCQKDAFWQSNILSTKKLREKFDQLSMKMQSPPQLQQTKKTKSFSEIIAERHGTG